MPFYDLKCSKCGNEFNKLASISQKTGKLIQCPDCGSNELLTVLKGAPNYIMKSNASPCPNSDSCGKACPHAS